MKHTAQTFVRALNDLADKALMATDTLEDTRRVEDARTYADEMVTSGLATYAEGLQLFKTKMGIN